MSGGAKIGTSRENGPKMWWIFSKCWDLRRNGRIIWAPPPKRRASNRRPHLDPTCASRRYTWASLSLKLDSANFPNRGRHPLAAASGTDRKLDAWQWIYEQVREGGTWSKVVSQGYGGCCWRHFCSSVSWDKWLSIASLRGTYGCERIIRNADDSAGAPHPDKPVAHGLPTCGMSRKVGGCQTEFGSRAPTPRLGTRDGES